MYLLYSYLDPLGNTQGLYPKASLPFETLLLRADAWVILDPQGKRAAPEHSHVIVFLLICIHKMHIFICIYVFIYIYVCNPFIR